MRTNHLQKVFGLLAALGLLGALSGCNGGETSGCDSDDDCRGDRVCSNGICLDPSDDDGGTEDDVAPDTGDDTSITPPPPDSGSPDTGFPRDTGEPTPDTGRDTGTPVDTFSPDTAPEDTGPDIPSPDAGMVGPQIKVIPANELDFGTITVPSTTTETLKITNDGDATLAVTRAELKQTPSQGFSVSGPSTPQNLAPGDTISYDITFDPNQQARYENQFVVESNDREQSDREIEVTLTGTAFNKVTQPCLFSTPDNLDYGIVKPGNSKTEEVTIGNCSVSSDVTVTEYNFLSNPNDVFSVDPSSPQPPYKVQVNQSKTLKLTFTPTSKRSVEGELSIRSDETTGGGDFVELAGSGGGCAEADAKGRVPMEDYDKLRDGPVPVRPGKGVELDGTESTSPSGKLEYDWSIISSPSGSSANLSSTTAPKPTLSPGTTGVYEVELQVTNPVSGNQGCVDDTIEIVSLGSDPELTVSSTWQASHDMNVHVVRTNSNGNFPNFRDEDNDVYPPQPTQDWGATGTKTDDAFHLGNSTGGSPGAERVLVTDLETGRDYRVALHFRDADGFRPRRFDAETTIEVQGSQESLTHEFTIRDRNKFWISFEIDGDTGSITQVDRER